MSRLQVLCPTIHQTDFSKIAEMNIRSDVIFANQADHTAHTSVEFEGHHAEMITTTTRGVGVNRNLLLMYANAEICLLADDDIRYEDDYTEKVCAAFSRYSNADIILFNIQGNSAERIPYQIKKPYRLTRSKPNPFGGPRIAFRISSIRKKNLWFTPLFGGGAAFPSGEDSMFLLDSLRCGLTIYCVPDNIGTVDMGRSTWYTGFDQKLYQGKGAYYAAAHPHSQWIWRLYFALRTQKKSSTGFLKAFCYLKQGAKLFADYKVGMTSDEKDNYC